MAAPAARILAIDDQLYFRSFLEGLLSEEGFEVRTADSGPAAWDTLETQGPFDLVIMDLALADTDGVSTVGRIRQRWPELAVIVVSGIGDVRSVVAAMREGASDYLLKPIDRESLIQSIGHVLEQSRVRVQNTRLLDENLEFMGRVSLLERALSLVSRTELPSAAEGVLDLMCVAAGAEDGWLWVADDTDGTFKTVAARGQANEDTLPEEWVPEDDALRAALTAGQPRTVGGALHIPCARAGQDGPELVAVARILPTGGGGPDVGEFAPAEIEACVKLGELAASVLANARALSQRSAPRKSLPSTATPAAAEVQSAPADALIWDAQTGLPSRTFFEEVLRIEIQKAHRYGRRLGCLCLDLAAAPDDPAVRDAVVDAMRRTLRTTDVLASEGGQRFWVLVTDTDSLGGVVLKRRIAERVREALGEKGVEQALAMGVTSYPLDGETREQLLEGAAQRIETERDSVIHQLGLSEDAPLSAIGAKLLAVAKTLPATFVTEAAETLVGELGCRPRDRGLLFLAPGSDGSPILAPLRALGDAETATEVFLATDGDTVPSGPAVTAIALPPDVEPESTWIVRFGEAPAYALIAGPTNASGQRLVFHTGDPVLVEHMTFRLRSEVGFGLRSGCGY